MKRLLPSVLAVLMVLALALPAAAQTPDGAAAPLRAQKGDKNSFIVVMGLPPVATYDGSVQGYEPTKPGKGGKINPNSAHVKKYEKFLQSNHNAALQAVGASADSKINEYAYALNGFSALLTPVQAEAMARQPGVVLVLPDQMRYKQTDSSPTFLGLTGPGGLWAKGYTGEGVVVGVIDSGIWPEHPSFADGGAYGPLPGIGPLPCEFGNTAQNPNDALFTCNNKLLGARQMLDTYRSIIGADPDEYDSARDDDGHGTHTASTAAGNANVPASLYGIARGTVSGIAPRARVVAYKGLGNLGGFTSDLAAAIDQAVADGVDVINYSIGGGASLTGGDDIAYLFAADAGVFVATSAGNSGPGPGTIGGPASVPWLTSVGASTQSRFFQATVVLGNGSSYTGASITPGTGVLPLVDAEFAGGDLCIPGTLDAAAVAGKIVLCRRGTIGRAEKSLAVAQAGGVGMIMYENTDDNNLFSDTHWVPSIHVDNTPGLAIKAYIAGTADPTAQINAEQLSQWPSAPSMTIFSSRGPDPVAEDIIKPDVTAPGIQILAGNSPTPDPGLYPGELFQAIAGTSMASPHVAGLFALIKQAHPDWSSAMAKSALMTTAYQDVRDNDRVSLANPFAMGAGHVDPGGKAGKGSVIEPGLAYDAGFLDYLGFLCEAGPEVFANPSATCASLAAAGIPTTARNLNLPSIGIAKLTGSETVQRTVTSVANENGWREYDVTMQAPPGYTVSVQPSSLRLKSGQSATYYVTITNVGAPVGEWRFGSLTWSDKTGNYDVYSPIAVKGALFSAPVSVSGKGVDGSASFAVKFGYIGSYLAAAHGLVPATVTSDNVVQDPDQNFDPNDGYSNRHDFNVAGAAFLRFAIPPAATEANADLDLYLYDPSGQMVAASTKGGTDEVIDVMLPADGAWSLYVHGWSTPGGDSPYELYSWIISAAPGGNLAVTTAPTGATIDAPQPVTVGWNGATAGQWHLGAVSHTGPSGLMGLTLVEVDNR
jgi:subtilisin family serine protease